LQYNYGGPKYSFLKKIFSQYYLNAQFNFSSLTAQQLDFMNELVYDLSNYYKEKKFLENEYKKTIVQSSTASNIEYNTNFKEDKC